MVSNKQVKKSGEKIKPVDYEISMTSLMLDFFNQKRVELEITYEDLAQSIAINYSILYGFLNNRSNLYLVHKIDYFILESMRKELRPLVSEIYDFATQNKRRIPQSPFFWEKMDYLIRINAVCPSKIISRMQFFDLLTCDYDIKEASTPKTITELISLYGDS